MTAVERLSVEVTNRCSKACPFCYNRSSPRGESRWDVETLLSFLSDCAAHGTRAVSFGGGEPLEWPGIFDLLERLRGILFRSVTTNGLPLDGPTLDRLAATGVEKVHASIHFPGRRSEVDGTLERVEALERRGVRGGVNLLVSRSRLAEAREAACALRAAGLSNEQIIYIPMRGSDAPTPEQLAEVAGRRPFQATSCLLRCRRSPRFCSVGWDRRVSWCSYTAASRDLREPTAGGLAEALRGLGIERCEPGPS